MRSSRRFLLAGSLAVLGCNSAPDIVAVGTTGNAGSPGGFDDRDAGEGCLPGHYEGKFSGDYGTSPFNIAVYGDLSFDIEETRDREFFAVTNATLQGTTTSDVTFSANVVSDSARGCQAGQFNSRLEKGRIADGTLGRFEGAVEGTYDAARREFKGEWTTQDPDAGTATGSGTWQALRIVE